MTSTQIDEITWQRLDQPTIAYVHELVHETLGDAAWARLKLKLARLEALFGASTREAKLASLRTDVAMWGAAVARLREAGEGEAAHAVICEELRSGYQAIIDELWP